MYLQPALNEQREAEVEAHLADCAACHKKAQTIRRLWAVSDSLKSAARRPAKSKSKSKSHVVGRC
jgi:anti-sigma factor RsiW